MRNERLHFVRLIEELVCHSAGERVLPLCLCSRGNEKFHRGIESIGDVFSFRVPKKSMRGTVEKKVSAKRTSSAKGVLLD